MTVRPDDTAHMGILLCLCANISSQINCKIFQEINFVDYTHDFGVRIAKAKGDRIQIYVHMYVNYGIIMCVIPKYYISNLNI